MTSGGCAVKPMKVDMSPQAIDRRLRRVSELRELCRNLAAAKTADRGADGGVSEPRDNRPVYAPKKKPE